MDLFIFRCLFLVSSQKNSDGRYLSSYVMIKNVCFKEVKFWAVERVEDRSVVCQIPKAKALNYLLFSC